MKFVAISDTHGLHRDLTLPEGDVIIHAGDFCDVGNEAQVHDFLVWMADLDFEFKVFIAGNHDLIAADQPKTFREIVPENLIYLENQGTEINGIRLWGSPHQPDLVSWAFGRTRGRAMEKCWEKIPLATDILITHTPPFGILDSSGGGRSVGCEMLAKRLADVYPDVHVFGHIHASYGELHQDGTHYINAASVRSQTGLINTPIVFEYH